MNSFKFSFILLCLSLLGCKKEQTQSSFQLSFVPSRGGLPNSTVIIKGMNFSTNLGANYVEFTGGLPGTVTASTGTELSVTVPLSASSGPILVVVNNNSRGITDNFNVLTGTVSTFSKGTYVEHLAIDTKGILYGDSTSNYGSFIMEFDHQGNPTLFTGGSYGQPFYGSLWGVAVDNAGNIFTNVNISVSKITPTSVVSTLAGSPTSGGFVNGTGDQARFLLLLGITVGPDNNIYVCDQPKIRKITQDGVVTTVAGSSVTGNTNGSSSVATFHSPEGIVLDASGNIYVSDTYNLNIRKIAIDGTVTTFAGSTTGQKGLVDGQGNNAQFYSPQGMAIDEAGNIFVSDSDYNDSFSTPNNSYIRMINASGYVTTLFGGPIGKSDGSLAVASMNGPDGIVFDSEGNIYFADTYNSSIRKITFQPK